MLLKDVQDVLVLHQFLLQVVVGVPAVRKLYASDLALVIELLQLNVDCDSSAGQQNDAYPVAVCVLGLQSQGFAL